MFCNVLHILCSNYLICMILSNLYNTSFLRIKIVGLQVIFFQFTWYHNFCLFVIFKSLLNYFITMREKER